MDTNFKSYDSYKYAFQSCKSYKDGAVNPNDFSLICQRYKLNYKVVTEQVSSNGEGRFSLDAFFHYMKRMEQYPTYGGHRSMPYSGYQYDNDSYTRPISPPPSRPSSASKSLRQTVHPSTAHPSNSSRSRYPSSPTGRDDREDIVRARTPDNFLSADDKRNDRMRSDHQPRPYKASRFRPMDTPPPATGHRSTRRTTADTSRSDKALSTRGGDSDEDDLDYPPPPRVSRHRPESESKPRRERVDHERSRSRDYENLELSYAQLLHEYEKLRHKFHKRNSNAESESSTYHDLYKAKEAAEEETERVKSSYRVYKKDCQELKADNQVLKLKIEDLQRSNWQLSDDYHKLQVKWLDEGRSSSRFSRRPGDGGSGEPSARSSIASDQAFQRATHIRNTYHGPTSGREVSMDPNSRSHRRRHEMKRVSSEGKPAEFDEPTKESYSNYPRERAKTNKSGTSSAGSIMDNLTLPLVSTTPDEQSQVFMVMGEDVSKSVLPEGLSKDKELAMMYALQNCHSVQELIKCLVSYGVSTSSDQVQGYQVENKHLKECVDHLKAKNTTISHSFQSAKLNMDEMYHTAEKIEANNVRLRHALKMAQQACEAFEVLLELRSGDSRSSYFPSFDNTFDSTSTRSPDRDHVSLKHTATHRARSLLHNLDSNVELQSYLPLVRMRQGSGDYQSHWPPAGTLSQATGTTSGLSSMSGGIEGEITQAEIDRLRQYSQALIHYKNHLVTTLVQVGGLKELDTIKSCEVIVDCEQASGNIVDLEDAAHAEELCKVREEKAELRSQIYMMEQEKRRMELEVSRMISHKQKCDRQLIEFQQLLKDEKRKRKKDQKKRKGDSSIPPHEGSHMTELSLEYANAIEREREWVRRYEDLFCFLQSHIKDSQDTTEQLMIFVKELRRANSALVDAFEKSKKRQQAEKKRMKQEIVSYMNRMQTGPLLLPDDATPALPLHT